MRIGIASPISLELIAKYVKNGEKMPKAYSFPFIALLVEELLRQGNEVVVFALSTETDRELEFKGDKLKINIIPLRKRARYKLSDFYSAERHKLTEAIKNESCDVIHAHWTRVFALAALASDCPCVITAHDAPINVLRYVRPWWTRLAEVIMAFIVCRKVKLLTAVSPYLKEHYERFFDYKGAIKVIPNGLPASIFEKYIPQQHKKNERFVFATCLSDWDGRKNGKAALKAFGELYEKNSNIELLMFGRGHEPGGMAYKWACKRGLEKGVNFIGLLPHDKVIERLSEEANVLIHPAIEEACSLAIIEAMVLGMPVIGGIKSYGVPYMLDFGKAGILVNVRSSSDIQRAMKSLADNKEYLYEMSEKSRSFAIEHYRLEDVVRRYTELYREAIKVSRAEKDAHG